ncbi:tumor necrosis factor receptor superfamily member 17 [Leptodactylus fuscus]|uniref:tumor necrosis factor receptor superfamily member 17 n=1 Tax=Leptodactylus fuscus TaxID=238119 RepID=UPI003F4EDA85
MGERCPAGHYFDELVDSCQSCKLRCGKLPSDCYKFNPCSRTTNNPVTHKEVPSTSVGLTITYKIKDPDSIEDANDTKYIIWLLLAFCVVLISTILIVTIILHRKRRLHADSFGKTYGNGTTKSSFKGTDFEQASCDELKKPVAENQDVENPVNISDNALSDYLFPLPAVEEGAAILVTTKTSACFNSGPGVRGDAFVEI